MHNQIDHIAVGAQSLEQGVAAMKQSLGVEVPRGGKHDTMNTHNCVMQAGNQSFFELISIDPDAPADPGRVRWFSLDEDETQNRLAQRPRALCWVVNTDDLDAVVAASPIDLGEIVQFTRGERSWRLTVPKDGHLPLGGLLPAFIEWSPGPHPSQAQQDLGVSLNRIKLQYPDPSELLSILTALGIAHLADISEGDTALSFEMNSPVGLVQLD